MARIVLADDDANLRSFAERALAGDGHEVVAVDDGLAALSIVSGGEVDLVVSDLDMPGLDGFGLFAQMRDRFPDIKVLLISGHEEELLRAAGLPGDRVATLAKPFTLQQIKAKVRELLTG